MSVNAIVADVKASTVKIGTLIQDESGSYWVSLHIVGFPRWKKLQARHHRRAKREAATLTQNYALVVALHTDVFVKTGMKVQILIPVQGDCQCTTACKDHILKVMKRQWGEHTEELSEVFTWCRLTGLKASKPSASGTITVTGKVTLRYENSKVSLRGLCLTMNHHLNRSGTHFPYENKGCTIKFSASKLITWKDASKTVYSQSLEEYKQWEAKQTDLIW